MTYRKGKATLEGLRVGAVITDALFDELRDGDTNRATWVNRFPSAKALQDACAAYVEANGGSYTKHTAVRMYSSWEQSQQQFRRKEKAKEQKEGEELAWARSIAQAENRQRYALNNSRRKRSRRKYQ